MYIAILGRQPALGIAELERIYGGKNVEWFSSGTAVIKSEVFSVEHLGGTQKAGEVVLELPRGDLRYIGMKIVQHYTKKWSEGTSKITLGISSYGINAASRDVQKIGIILKQKLKTNERSLRLIPNTDPALNTAVSHHNKLGLSENKIELLIVKAENGRVIVAESIGAQNITALAKRDQGRPKRDAFVGMLPPKLAQIIVNLATPEAIAQDNSPQVTKKPGHKDLIFLDPFCGTGVILQEAALMGYSVYGTDLSEKMVEYSQINLDWLTDAYHTPVSHMLHHGDAMTTSWTQPIHAVACESYLGQPFSAPPSPSKLTEVRGNCNHIISAFLKNIARQLTPGTPLCVAVPAWKDAYGDFTHLPLISQLEKLGFVQQPFKNIRPSELLYYREDQVVARELLVVVKT